MESTKYLDLENGSREPVFFYLLNAYLQSRIDTDHESDGDEEVNVYVAGLLESVVTGKFYSDNADHLAISATDVCEMADASESDRQKAGIYRTNADHRFLAFGLFAGWGEHVGTSRRAVTPDGAELEDAQQFYAWAALFVARLPSRYQALGVTFEKLADHFDIYREALRHMAANHLGLLPRLSRGETFHLERQAHEGALPKIEEFALDQMLDAYNDWRAQPCEASRERFFTHSETYTQLRPGVDTRYLVN